MTTTMMVRSKVDPKQMPSSSAGSLLVRYRGNGWYRVTLVQDGAAVWTKRLQGREQASNFIAGCAPISVTMPTILEYLVPGARRGATL